jgi:hypothetical protein
LLIERFESLLTGEFLARCDYNDFGELNLLTISDVIEDVRRRMEEKVWEEDTQ